MAGGLSRAVAPGDRGVCVTPVTPRFAWPPSCPGFSSSAISLPGERRCQGVVWSRGSCCRCCCSLPKHLHRWMHRNRISVRRNALPGMAVCLVGLADVAPWEQGCLGQGCRARPPSTAGYRPAIVRNLGWKVSCISTPSAPREPEENAKPELAV